MSSLIWRGLPAAALLLLAVELAAQPTPPNRIPGVALVVTPGRFDPLPLLEWCEEERLCPDRLFVRVLDRGQVRVATRSQVLVQAPTGLQAISAVADWAHARNIECWAVLDLLQWWQEEEPERPDPFEQRPDLEAGNPAGHADPLPEGRFASPFNAKVRLALVELVRELVGNYPALDGLLLSCRLPRSWMVGFDEPSRAAYIRHRQIDPIDLNLYGAHPEERDPEVREYYSWRLDTVGTLVGELAAAFKQGAAQGDKAKVAVVGRGNFYDDTMKNQARTCDDWLTWVVKGFVDEVVIEEIWKDETAPKGWEAASNLIAKSHRKVPLTCLLTARPRYKQYNLMKGWAFFQEKGKGVERIIIDPYYARCVGDAKAILRGVREWKLQGE